MPTPSWWSAREVRVLDWSIFVKKCNKMH